MGFLATLGKGGRAGEQKNGRAVGEEGKKKLNFVDDLRRR
jgi:hypothetical protein